MQTCPAPLTCPCVNSLSGRLSFMNTWVSPVSASHENTVVNIYTRLSHCQLLWLSICLFAHSSIHP